jgi:hypothetical protein
MNNYFAEYDTRHEAIRLLWEAWQKAPHGRLRRVIANAVGHIRESALDLIPYGATTPNKDSYGRRYGKRV